MEYIVEYVWFINIDRCQVKIDIGNRLREYRKRNNIKMPEIAKATGIKLNTLYKWEKGTKPIDWLQQLVLEDYLDTREKDPGNFVNEESGIYHGSPRVMRIRIPVISNHPSSHNTHCPTTWGFRSTLDDGEPFFYGGYKHAPRLDQGDYVITLVGESMCPTFESGSKMVLQKIESPLLLVWGSLYFIIDKNKQGIFRRIVPGETSDTIVLTADHPNKQLFPDIIRWYGQISAILKVEPYQARG
jgi:hypothetical protein